MTFCPKRLRLIAPAVLLALPVALLGGCSGTDVKETLGMNRVAPDEFKVVSRPPLTVPPQFSLLPPDTGNEGPQDQAAADKAKETVMGDSMLQPTPAAAETAVKPVKSKSLSASAPRGTGNPQADSQFMQRFGADKADPNVRKQLTEDRINKQIKEEDESWWDMMTSPAPKAKDPMVNAPMESERIKDNTDSGKPVNEGETPTVKEKDRGILGRILGD